MTRRVLSIFVLCAALLSGGCLNQPTHTKSYTGDIPPATRPSADEISASKSLLFDQVAKQEDLKLHQGGSEYIRVKKIVARLSKTVGLGDWSYPVYMADAEERTNAFALNNNTIVVYDELARRVKDNQELATILSHEVSHILGNHNADTTAQQRQIGIVVAAQVIGAIVGAHVGSVAGSIAEQGTQIAGVGAFVHSYNRAMEYEADEIGMLLMAKAGYDPHAALRFWEHADEILEDGLSGGSDFLSTHPTHDNRMQHLRKVLPKAMTYYKK